MNGSTCNAPKRGKKNVLHFPGSYRKNTHTDARTVNDSYRQKSQICLSRFQLCNSKATKASEQHIKKKKRKLWETWQKFILNISILSLICKIKKKISDLLGLILDILTLNSKCKIEKLLIVFFFSFFSHLIPFRTWILSSTHFSHL